jgi:putative aldouronate transport system substrate-binding protein
MSRGIVAAVVIAFSAAVAFGAGGTDSAAKPEQGPLEIKWAGLPNSGMYPTEDSYIVQELNKRYNVKIKIVRGDSLKEQEMNLLFASGEIPDHFLVLPQSALRVMNEGLGRQVPLATIKKDTPKLFSNIELNHPQYMNLPVYKDGNFYGVPEGSTSPFRMTAVRTDWLKKVGAGVPTTLEEFENVARLFTTADPDGDGKAGTFGFDIGPDSYDSVVPIAAAFGVLLPNGSNRDEGYVVGSNGTLTRAQISENYKAMLKYLAGLYKKGYVHPDVTLKEPARASLYSDGIVGMRSDGHHTLITKYFPSGWLALTAKKNPNATFDYMPAIKGPGGKDALYEKQYYIWRYMMVGKNTSDAKMAKILRILNDQLDNLEMHNLIWRGIEGLHFTVDNDGMAIATKEYSTNEKQIEVGMKYFIINSREQQHNVLAFGRELDRQYAFQKSWKTVNQLLPPGTLLASVTEVGADVRKIEQQFYLNAITGISDVEAEWDGYVRKWNAAGGDRINKEATEIFAKLKK